MILKIHHIYIFIVLIALYSCNDDVTGGMKVKPAALGRLNEIVVLAEEELWEGETKDSFEFYFGSAYPIMPRPESLFDIRHFTPRELDLEPLRKELRTYVLIADLSDAESRSTTMVRTDLGEERYRKALAGEITSTVGKDKWARGQLIIYLMGTDKAALHKTIKESYPSVSRRVNVHDEEQLKAKIYAAKSNPGMSNEILNKYGVKLKIPAKFLKALDKPDDNFLWLRKDTKNAVMNIVISKFPYSNKNQLNVENLKSYRDELGVYMTTDVVGSRMIINDVDLPVYDYTYTIDEKYAREIRGVWEMTKDFLGGPFASYAILNEKKGEIVFIDTFVYAPGVEKRNMMQQLDYIAKHAMLP